STQGEDMQTTLNKILMGAGLLVVAGCAGRQVTTDYNPEAGFSQYRTFAMVSSPDSLSHQLIDDRVRSAVEAQLTDKGLTETSRESADLYVGYGVVDHTRQEVSTTRWDWARGWGWRYYRWGLAWPAITEHDITTYTDGTIVVSLVDAKTHREVWQGQAADVLSLPVTNPKNATKDINQAVAKIFTKYPPDQV
ncbi:MAG TPA: DUF4136 domain-containing protein, partial [Gemmatimonadales bacterium]|nr:DUF4136 domain-containing protein [Gemmatimonadales bacterium]